MRIRTLFGYLYVITLVGLFGFMMVSKTAGNRAQKHYAYSVPR
jgi:hypothetical protein